MRLTNKFNLPQPIVDAVKNDTYNKGNCDYSVTQLLKPPRLLALERIYKDNIEEDVSDRIFSLLGQLMHGLLERADITAVAERRLTITVLGKTVSGQMDRAEAEHESVIYSGKVLQDYKLTTVYKARPEGALTIEWVQQLNCYAAILREHNVAVEKAEIVAVLRDWHKGSVAREDNYPPNQIAVIDIPLWPHKKAMGFIAERIVAHESAKKALPLCTPEERWATPTQWAVIKPDAKRASKLFSEAEFEEASACAIKLGGGAKVAKRVGESKRCEAYCLVARFCDQFKEIKR